ncbi:MAG: glycoside hydrolase family 3 N-terminal domain-containing protein [Candidatus Thiodiazotropha sp.]|jgi:beta-N-acetylhexosaminidase
MKSLFYIVFVLMVLALIMWSLNIGDPHLLFLRRYEFWIISSLALILFFTTFFIKVRYFSVAAQLGLLAAVQISSYSTYTFSNEKSRFLYAPSDSVKVLNRRMIVGFDNWNEIRQLSKNGIAGIFLTSRNIKDITYEDLKYYLESLQQEREALGLPPLFISTDQEGGAVSRLSPLIKRQEPLASLLGAQNAEQLAYEYGQEQGRLLASLGVNLNFSPVVDLKPAAASGMLDFHSRIATRAISDDPKIVTKLAKSYIKGLERHGVSATLKHFPGLAKVANDTHHFSALLDTEIDDLEKKDWVPFIEISQDTQAWIMLSHVVLSRVDSENPVSTSKQVIDNLIRKRLGFKGVLITDDMTMGATFNRGFCRSVKQSFATSVSYLLIAYDYDKYYDAIHCLESIHTQNQIDRKHPQG